MSIGDLLSGNQNTVNQIAQLMRGPQPTPGAQGSPPGPGGGQGAPAGPPGQPGSPSTAPQSPPDLAQLYLRLQQQDRAAAGMDRALAGMSAALSAPGTAQNAFAAMPPPQDAGQQLGTMLQLQQMQNLARMPAPTGMDPNTAAIWPMLPPDAKLKYIEAQGAANIDISKQGALTKQADLEEAQKKAPTSISLMQQMDQAASGLQNMKEADGSPVLAALTQSGVTGAAKRNAADILIKAAADDKEHPGAFQNIWNSAQLSVLTPEEKAAVQQIIMLKGQIYGQEFINAGSRRTQTEINSLQSGVNPLVNFNQPYDSYMKQFGDFQKRLHTGLANTYGAAGRADEIPDNIKWDMSDPKNPKPLVDSAYLPGGNMYAGKGGQWASNPPKPQAGETGQQGGAGKTYTYNPKTGQLE